MPERHLGLMPCNEVDRRRRVQRSASAIAEQVDLDRVLPSLSAGDRPSPAPAEASPLPAGERYASASPATAPSASTTRTT
jgi:cobyrinic acid a,c-diamide synthase